MPASHTHELFEGQGLTTELPKLLDIVDNIGHWAARLDLLLITLMTVCVVKSKLKYTTLYWFKITSYIYKKTGLVGLAAGLGTPLLLDFVFLPIALFQALTHNNKEKKDPLEVVQDQLLIITGRLDRIEGSKHEQGTNSS